MKQYPYRQGDVYLQPIKDVPVDCKKLDGAVVLALGETSGHSHRFTDNSGVCGFFKEGAEDHTIGGGSVLVGGATPVSYITVPEAGAKLLHLDGQQAKGDHNPIPVEPGAYKVIRQREFEAEGIERQVVD